MIIVTLASVVGVNNTLKIPSEIIRINTLLILNILVISKEQQKRCFHINK